MITMRKYVKWYRYLWISILIFCGFLFEYLVIFMESMLLGFNISSYTPVQRSVHHILMAVIWSVLAGALLIYSDRLFQFPRSCEYRKRSRRNWITAILCLAGCKVLTFLDWHTLKVIGEFQGNALLSFSTQYLYYFAEVGLVLLILMYGQKAAESFMNRESSVPFGGILLAFTWGAFHFVSRGVGFELWNGISCMIFSLLAGMMYVQLKRKPALSYVFLAIGYLL